MLFFSYELQKVCETLGLDFLRCFLFARDCPNQTLSHQQENSQKILKPLGREWRRQDMTIISLRKAVLLFTVINTPPRSLWDFWGFSSHGINQSEILQGDQQKELQNVSTATFAFSHIATKISGKCTISYSAKKVLHLFITFTCSYSLTKRINQTLSKSQKKRVCHLLFSIKIGH